MLKTVILTKLRVQSINGVSLPYIASNKLRIDSIRLVNVYVCDLTHDEILETNFQGNNKIMMSSFWKEKYKLVMIRVNLMKDNYSMW